MNPQRLREDLPLIIRPVQNSVEKVQYNLREPLSEIK